MLTAEFSYFLHQTWDSIEDSLTIERMVAYRRLWRRSPPVDLLAAGFMGYKAPDDVPPDGLSGLERGIEKLARVMGVQLPPARTPDGK